MLKKKDKKRYYIIGIGGVAMGNLAGLLKQKGHDVAGSDQATMYEPMKSMLKNLGIKVFAPYNKFHMKQWKPDIVVVGNAISRGNPELEYAMSNGHIYRSVSDILREEFIDSPIGLAGGKKAIVIAGTHGKTTTTALIAWILEYAGLDPTIFIGGSIIGFPPKADRPTADTRQQVAIASSKGGQVRNIPLSCKLGKGEYVVLEGDEYNTAFFDKNPKFLGYRPYIGLINNVELDHVDIFHDIGQIKQAFLNFASLIPQNGLLSVNLEDEGALDVLTRKIGPIKNLKNINKPKISTFGISVGDFSLKKGSLSFSDGRMLFHVKYRNKLFADISVGIIGIHNIGNILGAISVASFLGISKKFIIGALSSYSGVKRRLEKIHETEGITVIDDYAHHPTAVLKTILAVKQAFHGKRIIAVFEPGSASSKKRIFEEQYFKALLNADEALLYKPYRSEAMSSKERFSGNAVTKRLNKAGVKSKFFDDVDKLLFHVKSTAKSGDIVLVMSCRGFDGLREKLIKEL